MFDRRVLTRDDKTLRLVERVEESNAVSVAQGGHTMARDWYNRRQPWRRGAVGCVCVWMGCGVGGKAGFTRRSQQFCFCLWPIPGNRLPQTPLNGPALQMKRHAYAYATRRFSSLRRFSRLAAGDGIRIGEEGFRHSSKKEFEEGGGLRD